MVRKNVKSTFIIKNTLNIYEKKLMFEIPFDTAITPLGIFPKE